MPGRRSRICFDCGGQARHNLRFAKNAGVRRQTHRYGCDGFLFGRTSLRIVQHAHRHTFLCGSPLGDCLAAVMGRNASPELAAFHYPLRTQMRVDLADVSVGHGRVLASPGRPPGSPLPGSVQTGGGPQEFGRVCRHGSPLFASLWSIRWPIFSPSSLVLCVVLGDALQPPRELVVGAGHEYPVGYLHQRGCHFWTGSCSDLCANTISVTEPGV
mmetsp:Transcript_8320/g.17257  ORF Transcript_8320/g.17257 Transcript_8320/m.17257 type:complete len:214 (+) Transcript_8320:130-771(+)